MNAYTYSYCPNCGTMHTGSQLMLHGVENISKAMELVSQGKTVEEIYQSFCGYCGSFIEGKECTCGHTRRQTYYED